MGVQLAWLRTFVTVYRLGSFTRAAHDLGLSQPAVTHQIRNLERELGRPLFERLPDGARPTPAADELIPQIQAPMDALTSAVERIFDRTATDRVIYLGGPVELMTTRVVPAVGDLMAHGQRLRFSFGVAEELLADLERGKLDLVVSTVRPRRRGLAATPLVDEEFVLVGSAALAPTIPREELEAGNAAVLDHVPVISYDEALPIVRRYWHTVFGAAPTFAPAVVVPDLRGALAAVRASAGISVLPTYLCADELARGEILPLLEPELPPINTFYLVVRRGDLGRPDVAALHDHLLREARLWA